ncbi:MAG TPA: CHRD domain-containing protein [Planctomycetota bacterium]|nr:CHRD domain-containing protein [Planctomycetota bacterium]
MQSGMRAAAVVLLALLVPACGGDFGGFFVPFPNTAANGFLRGSQVVPALGTGATGTATITSDGLGKFVDYTIAATGLGTVTAIEIRLGDPGENGAVILTIPLGAFPLSGRIDAPTFFAPVAGLSTFAEICSAIAEGHTYLLISTVAQAAGEIRAHLGKAALASAKLTGGQMVPPVATTGSGSATVELDPAQAQITVTLTVAGVTGITGAQIREGAPLVAGGVLFDVSAAPFTSPLTVILTSGDFTPSGTIATFTDAINAFLSGGLYIQVNAAQSIRGQVGPTQLSAFMTGANVVNPSGSAATGTATLALNGSQTAFFVTVTHTVAAADRSTISAATAGTNGPMIFNLAATAGAATSPFSTTVTPSRLIPNTPANILTFPDAVNALLTGGTYIDVGNASFPGGEIRDQLLP